MGGNEPLAFDPCTDRAQTWLTAKGLPEAVRVVVVGAGDVGESGPTNLQALSLGHETPPSELQSRALVVEPPSFELIGLPGLQQTQPDDRTPSQILSVRGWRREPFGRPFCIPFK